MIVEHAPPSPAVQAATFVAADHDYGDVLTEKYLTGLLGTPLPDIGTRREINTARLNYSHALKAMRSVLLEEPQMLLQTRGTTDYVIVQPRDHLGVALERGKKRVRKALRELRVDAGNVNAAKLSATERTEFTDANARIKTFAMFVRRELKKV